MDAATSDRVRDLKLWRLLLRCPGRRAACIGRRIDRDSCDLVAGSADSTGTCHHGRCVRGDRADRLHDDDRARERGTGRVDPSTDDRVAVEPPPATLAPLISELPVAALAAALGVEGDVEQLDGEHGPGYCVGRLEPRGLCVNVPLWGLWQYWDLDAQNSEGASDDQAITVAVELFDRLGVDAGEVTSVEHNGPPNVELSRGASVIVSNEGRIAMVYADTALLPTDELTS